MVDRTDPRPAILISGRNEEARANVCAEVERRYSDDYLVVEGDVRRGLGEAGRLGGGGGCHRRTAGPPVSERKP